MGAERKRAWKVLAASGTSRHRTSPRRDATVSLLPALNVAESVAAHDQADEWLISRLVAALLNLRPRRTIDLPRNRCAAPV